MIYSINFKSRSLWLLKNVHRIFVLLLSYFSRLLCTTPFTYGDFDYRNDSYAIKNFSKFQFLILKTLLKDYNGFWKTTLTLSFKYWFLRILLLSDNLLLTVPNQLIVKKKLYLNQYSLALEVSNVSVHNKFYRKILFQVLFFILTWWPKYNQSFFSKLQFFIANNHFQYFKFSNFYFFKLHRF